MSTRTNPEPEMRRRAFFDFSSSSASLCFCVFETPADLFHLSVPFRKMIADIFGESGDEEEEEFTVSTTPRVFVPFRLDYVAT